MRACLRHVGRTEDWDGARATVPAFTTVDALLGYTTRQWTLRFHVSNLTDENHAAVQRRRCVYGDGRRATGSPAHPLVARRASPQVAHPGRDSSMRRSGHL
jgi:outer membrane receptor protein involved in Fe transport